MAWYALLGLFIIKHGFLVHWLDFGYSVSRSPVHAQWHLGLFLHLSMGTIVSFVILRMAGFSNEWAFLVLELLAGCAACYMERTATFANMLRRHLLGEGLSLLTYGLAVFTVFNSFC